MSADGEDAAGKQASFQTFVAIDANSIAAVEIGHVPGTVAQFEQTVSRRNRRMRDDDVAFGRSSDNATITAKHKRRAAAAGNKLTEHAAALPFGVPRLHLGCKYREFSHNLVAISTERACHSGMECADQFCAWRFGERAVRNATKAVSSVPMCFTQIAGMIIEKPSSHVAI